MEPLRNNCEDAKRANLEYITLQKCWPQYKARMSIDHMNQHYPMGHS